MFLIDLLIYSRNRLKILSPESIYGYLATCIITRFCRFSFFLLSTSQNLATANQAHFARTMNISRLPIVLLAGVLLLACDAGSRTSSGVSQAVDALNTYCGDGVLAVGIESCDDGNTVDDDACTNLCHSSNATDTLVDLARTAFEAGSIGFCGDGIRNGIESCDDGNLDDTDRCSSSCLLNDSATPSWYVRDDPIADLPYCGDGLVNQSIEECDDGNGDDTDHCTNRCLIQDPVDPPQSTVSTNQQSQQEDNSCFELHTELGLPTELCD